MLLKHEPAGRILSDEGHTNMHFTCIIDERELRQGNRQKVISNALAVFAVEYRDGELRLNVPGEQFCDA